MKPLTRHPHQNATLAALTVHICFICMHSMHDSDLARSRCAETCAKRTVLEFDTVAWLFGVFGLCTRSAASQGAGLCGTGRALTPIRAHCIMTLRPGASAFSIITAILSVIMVCKLFTVKVRLLRKLQAGAAAFVHSQGTSEPVPPEIWRNHVVAPRCVRHVYISAPVQVCDARGVQTLVQAVDEHFGDEAIVAVSCGLLRHLAKSDTAKKLFVEIDGLKHSATVLEAHKQSPHVCTQVCPPPPSQQPLCLACTRWRW